MNRKSLSELTSNQYWGGLNRRFDKRVALLAKLGVHNIGGNGWPSRRTKWDSKQETLVPVWVMTAQFVMHADNRAWREMLPDLIRPY